jgi:hypothetical protein
MLTSRSLVISPLLSTQICSSIFCFVSLDVVASSTLGFYTFGKMSKFNCDGFLFDNFDIFDSLSLDLFFFVFLLV